MENKRSFNKKGITLVALIVTIVILLILAGVAIGTLSGKNGLLSKATLAKNKYEISEAKEKLEFAITELRIEEEGKGESFTKEDLIKLNNDKIDVKSTESFPVEIIYEKYKFTVDEQFIVTYIGEANETIITYTTTPEGYTNQDSIKLTVKISNPKGIRTVEFPDGGTVECFGKTEYAKDFSGIVNGTYTYKATDMDGNETTKEIVIDKIDKLAPLDFTPTIEELKSTSFVIVANAQDAESDGTNSKSGIERYEYYVNGTKYESNESSYKVTGLTKETQYSIYVKGYDKAGNDKQSITITGTTTKGDYPTLTLNGMSDVNNIDIASDSLILNSFDNNFNTYQAITGTGISMLMNEYLFKIDPECWGKYLTIYCQTPNSIYGCISLGSSYETHDDKLALWYLSEYTNILPTELCARSILIPEGSYWGNLTLGSSTNIYDFNVYEIWCSEDDLSGNVYSNDNRP